MDRIHVLSRTEGKTNKKLICSIFVTKRKDEMYAMYYLSLPTCLCRKEFLYIQNAYLAEGFQPSDPMYWFPPSLFQILSYPNPLLVFCFVSMVSHVIASNFLNNELMIYLQSGFSKYPWWGRG